MNAYHDAKAQAQRAREEDVAILDAKVGLARKEAHEDIDAYDGRAKDASFIENKMVSRQPITSTEYNIPKPLTADKIHPLVSLSILLASSFMATLLFSSLLEQGGCGYGGTGIKRSACCVSL